VISMGGFSQDFWLERIRTPPGNYGPTTVLTMYFLPAPNWQYEIKPLNKRSVRPRFNDGIFS